MQVDGQAGGGEANVLSTDHKPWYFTRPQARRVFPSQQSRPSSTIPPAHLHKYRPKCLVASQYKKKAKAKIQAPINHKILKSTNHQRSSLTQSSVSRRPPQKMRSRKHIARLHYSIILVPISSYEAACYKLTYKKDKAPADKKEQAHTQFQEIAFAYALLSDPKRRARYDKTGSTSESLEDDDFDWTTFYSEQFKDIITPDAIETFAKAYRGSDEEKDDVLAAYEKSKGAWKGIYEQVMLSDMLEDEERFRGYIDEGIKNGDVEAYDKYTKETAQQKERRFKAARKEAEQEAREAEEEAAKPEVQKKMTGKKGGKKDAGLNDLAALIQSRQASRGDFFDALEAKYAQPEQQNGKKGKKGKRGSEEVKEEPSEEAFQAAAARLKKGGAKIGGERSAKRVKK